MVKSLYDAPPAVGVPGGGGLPHDANTGSVTIKNGKIDPGTIDAQVGLPYILTVRSTRSRSRISSPRKKVKAQGDTLIQGNISEGVEGEKKVLVDGTEAGTLRVQGAGGVVNP